MEGDVDVVVVVVSVVEESLVDEVVAEEAGCGGMKARARGAMAWHCAL